MFIKKKKVKIIIQGSVPLQFPEVTFARKSQDYSSCKLAQSQRSKPTPATSPESCGEMWGGCQNLGPSPQDTLPACTEQLANSLSFPSTVRDKGD